MRDEIVRPVQAQLDAYNDGNLELFLAQYQDGVEIFDLHGKVLVTGKNQMRKNYGMRFAENPNLRADVPQRMVITKTRKSPPKL